MEKEEKKEVKEEEVTTPKGEEKEQSEVKDEVTETEKTNGSDDKAGEKTDAEVKTDAAPQPDEEAEAPQPEVQVEEMGNGIPLSEVALKADVKAMIEEVMAPFKAKYEALAKENEDLKNALAEAKKDAEDTHAKYERGDFGAPARKGEGFGGTKGGGNQGYVSYDDMWAGKKNFD